MGDVRPTALATLAACAACGIGVTGERVVVVPRSAVDPDGWIAQVRDAVAAWRAVAPCGFPVIVSEQGAGTPVELVPPSQWRRSWSDGTWFPRIWPFRSPRIAVRGDERDFAVSTIRTDYRATIAHELGHAVGLEHSDDLTSTMNWTGASSMPSPRDGQRYCDELARSSARWTLSGP